MYNLSTFRKNNPTKAQFPSRQLKAVLVKEDIPEQDWFGIYSKTPEYDKDGYDKDGNDKDGYSRFGWNQWGYDREGYNKFGLDMHGNPKPK